MKNKTKLFAIFAIGVSLIFVSGCVQEKLADQDGGSAAKSRQNPAPITTNPDINGQVENSLLTLTGTAARDESLSIEDRSTIEHQYYIKFTVRNDAPFPVVYEKVKVTFTRGSDSCDYFRNQFWVMDIEKAERIAPGQEKEYEFDTLIGNNGQLDAYSRLELKLTVIFYHGKTDLNEGYEVKVPPKLKLPFKYGEEPYSLNFTGLRASYSPCY